MRHQKEVKREVEITKALSSSKLVSQNDSDHMETERISFAQRMNEMLGGIGSVKDTKKKANCYSISVSYTGGKVGHEFRESVMNEFPCVKITSVNGIDEFNLVDHKAKDCVIRSKISDEMRNMYTTKMGRLFNVAMKFALIVVLLACMFFVLRLVKPEKYVIFKTS